MDDELDPLLIDIRANTAGFAADIARMRSSFDGQLLDGFGRAGDVLERGLLSAIRKGSLGFEDLKRVALGALDQIAGQALQLGLDRVMGSGGKSGGIGGVLEPMQANPTIIGDNCFIGASHARDVRVNIALPTARGAEAPVALRRSARQIASAVRRAVVE
jgi:hypothetical protein